MFGIAGLKFSQKNQRPAQYPEIFQCLNIEAFSEQAFEDVCKVRHWRLLTIILRPLNKRAEREV